MLLFLRRESLWIPVILLIIMIGCWSELDLYAPSFPQMMHYFSTSEQMMQWTLSLNFLGFFLASLLCGPLADSFGRRKIILAGSLIFVLGSYICLRAPTMGWMLFGRLVQGIGVSAPVTVCMAVIADIYQGERQVKLLSRVNSAITVSMALAPVVGVYLTDSFGWHANFVAIFIVALFGAITIWLFVPETHDQDLRVRFKAKSLIDGYWTLLKSKEFMADCLGLCLSVTPYFILVGILPLLFMEEMGVPIKQYTFYQGSIIGLYSALSLSLPWILAKFEMNKVVFFSVVMSMGALLVSFVCSLLFPMTPVFVLLLMLIYVAGIVVPPTVMFSGAMDRFPELRACASSLIQSLRMLSMSVGTAITGMVYDGSFRAISLVMLSFMALSIPATIAAFQRRARSSAASTLSHAMH
ncbi:MAG TPA: multidrug effflux MFS transporter [Myxococcota bacterium]|nr:multidrug effflux MFS transporter [Myxococcota bacterium]